MRWILAGAGLVLTIAIPQTSWASDWQYCLAPSHAENKVYISGTFRSADLGSADSSFERMLSLKGLRHDDVQCPRADDESSILAMLRYAISYNKKIGAEIIYVSWEPTS